jgi:hypothetical protein
MVSDTAAEMTWSALTFSLDTVALVELEVGGEEIGLVETGHGVVSL